MHQRRFSNKVFQTMLITGTLTVVIQFLILLSDTVIAGNLLGESYLSAISIVKPIYSLAIFCATLISIGTSVYYSYQIGCFNTKEANQIFSQGVIISIIFGVLLLLFGIVGQDIYIEFLDVSDQVASMAKQYFAYYKYVILLVPLYTVLLEIVYADGDQLICNVSCILQFTVNVVGSVMLCQRLGVRGIGIGTLWGILVSISVLVLHFFRKSSNLSFDWYLNYKDALKVFKCGMTDASAYLFMGILSFVSNVFISYSFGEYYLPILLAVMDILELTLVFDGIGQAITPLVNVYRGEENQTGIKRIMKSALKVAIVEGIITTAILCIFGNQISYLLGMRDPELIKQCTLAIRLVSPFFFCTGILFLQTTYYMIIGKVLLATSITGIKDSVVPLILMIALGFNFGINFVWVGLGLSPFVALCLVSIFLIIRYGKKRFPLLLNEPVKLSYVYDALLSEETIIQLCNEVSDELKLHKYDNNDIELMLDYINNSTSKILNNNKEKNILLECSLLLSDKVEIILRDDGELMDCTKIQITSSADTNYRLESTDYMVTIGYNRNIYRFEKE